MKSQNKRFNKFVTTILLGFLFSETCGQTCIPSTDCAAIGAGGLVPDPHDCEKYYVCVISNGQLVATDSSLKCPEGQFFEFDPVLGTGSCAPETSPGICTSACGAHVCTTQCPADPPPEFIFVADENDCAVYHICTTSGTQIPNQCPTSTPNFDGVDCTDDKTSCCKCRPVCKEAGTLIQDPCNCYSYFVCTGAGQPHSINRLTCKAGYYFDAVSSQCVAGGCFSVCTGCTN